MVDGKFVFTGIVSKLFVDLSLLSECYDSRARLIGCRGIPIAKDTWSFNS